MPLTDQQHSDLEWEHRSQRQFRADREILGERVANRLVNENIWREDFPQFLAESI